MNTPPDKYNVLFIISDQHKMSVTGCYGDDLVRTPAIDSLAARGTLFANAFCPSPLCGPSRSAIMTGTWPHTCRGITHGQPLPIRDIPTLGSVFRDAGYATASLGKVHIRGEDEDRDFGFDERALRIYTYEWQEYIDAIGLENVDKYASYHKHAQCEPRNHYNPENVPVELEDELMYDSLVVDLTVDFLEKHKDEPFFAWVGLEKPHPQWYAPAPFHGLYDPAQMPLPETLWENPDAIPASVERVRSWGPRDTLSEDQIKGCIAAYYANVSYLDSKVGILLRKLDELGLSDNTIVVYTTDHGDHLFEHGMVQKHCFYDSAVAVPLIIAGPGIPADARRKQLVSLIDLFPTLLEMNNIPRPDTLEGVSLGPAIHSDAPLERSAVFSEFYSSDMPERMIRTNCWKYIHSQGDICQLYDLTNDPLETNNLINADTCQDIVEELRNRLMTDWEQPDPELYLRTS